MSAGYLNARFLTATFFSIRSLAVMTVLFALLPQAHAQSSYGAGETTCTQFLKAARTSDILYHQASNWLLGYVSGMNAGLKAAKDISPMTGFSNDQLLKSAATYCESHPASTIRSAIPKWLRKMVSDWASDCARTILIVVRR